MSEITVNPESEESEEEEPDLTVSLQFVISSSELLDMEEITQSLGIEPSYSCLVGEGYQELDGVRIQDKSIWSLDSEGWIDSWHVDDHARLMLEKLEPVAEVIEQYLQDSSLDVTFHVWHETEDIHGGHDFDSNILIRLSRLCRRFEFAFTNVGEY